MRDVFHLPEPHLRFGHGQTLEHPKDGLTLFGPYTRKAGSVRFGVIGTQMGLAFFDRWSANINRFLPAYEGSRFTRKKGREVRQIDPSILSLVSKRFLALPGTSNRRCDASFLTKRLKTR